MTVDYPPARRDETLDEAAGHGFPQHGTALAAADPGPRTLTHFLYAMHTLTWFSGGIFSVIAIIVNSVKFGDLPNDFFRSHWRWQSRTFWFALVAFLVTSPLWFLFVVPGWIAWTIVGLWYLYRCIRGWINFNDDRAMPV